MVREGASIRGHIAGPRHRNSVVLTTIQPPPCLRTSPGDMPQDDDRHLYRENWEFLQYFPYRWGAESQTAKRVALSASVAAFPVRLWHRHLSGLNWRTALQLPKTTLDNYGGGVC